MLCHVFRLNEKGLPRRIPLPPVTGDLYFFKWQDGSNRVFRRRAELRNGKGNSLLPVMFPAEITKVSAAGLVVHGTEYIYRTESPKSQGDHYPQVWWCQIIRYEGMLPAPLAVPPADRWGLGVKPDGTQEEVPAWRRALLPVGGQKAPPPAAPDNKI